MQTKISMKNIYLILVVSIGLIGLGLGSTYAVFTASAEISNPISFSSNLSYNSDVFESTEITIEPNSSKDVNFAISNEDEQIEGLKYATWYIYDGDSSDLVFSADTSSIQDAITVSGDLNTWGGVIYITVTNNTSNTITITMGVAISKDDIVLPSYMKLVTITETYTLNLSKGTGVSKIYYKINEASSWTFSTNDVSLSLENGTTYSYYGEASSGYTMDSCTESSFCSGTMGTSSVSETLSATVNSYNLTLNKGTGVSKIYYKIGANSWTYSLMTNITLSVNYGTRYYYYGTPSTGYTMDSCTESSHCSGEMGTSAVTKTLSATATSTGPFTVIITVLGSEETSGTTSNGTFTATGVYTGGLTNISCTNGATATLSGDTVTVTNVTADTTCNIS